MVFPQFALRYQTLRLSSSAYSQVLELRRDQVYFSFNLDYFHLSYLQTTSKPNGLVAIRLCCYFPGLESASWLLRQRDYC